ncbi:protein of unknown function DUF224 cysteine-rich region domain protein [Desulfofarcimen acetoxidans DSM 771]|uniref:Glycolate oxidase iron-sulfur subunit n=1 Tax=Desulfofarcimen acetoxidans (strain ATCC 49208 / DSM 771 / KCTC 5769 / VKM B-1644 / 5575) TaxID=485916 RepID=C8W3A9_DESAS|nr:(Fe-S)-binding protein [Desulfofarcimen acetoxidans]ACV61876.1 protein of unknown function DUF224 cysteine-rich region domain protein [Desulfofarcimen acetoxidans DSM 771]
MLSQPDQLKDIQSQFQKCVRCGLCRSVCPIFKEDRRETAAPRGKVFLAQMLAEGEITPDSKAAQNLSMCLMCESCSSECPSGIEVHKIVSLARSMVNENNPSLTNKANKLIFKDLWSKPSLMNLSFNLIKTGQALGLLDFGTKSGLLPKSGRLLGELPGKPARQALPEIVPPTTRQKARTGYFLGCATNYLYPQVAFSTVKILSHLGCEVVIPRELTCCGLPQLANGEPAAGHNLARQNLQIFKRAGVEAVVCDCASCSATLAENWGQALPVYDAVKYIIQELKLDLSDKKQINNQPIKIVTYHDPCHLAKAQRIRQQPRQLLQMLPGVEYREMPGADNCCGGAGTFVVKNYDLSMRILDRKIASIKETGADIVATCCPTCTMQLKHGLDKHGLQIEVKHPLELLAETLGL